MADVRDLFYHGVRHQVRRVLEAMGEDRILNGITAFETGMSNWSACFFARAYPEMNLNYGDPELKIAEALGMGRNRIPMRIVYTLFDGVGRNRTMAKDQLLEFIRGFLDEQRDPAVQQQIDELIRGTDLSKAQSGEGQVFDLAACSTGDQPWG